MQSLINYLVTSLVENPAEVKIEETVSDKNLNYRVHVSQADLGKVIGRRGRTIKAMRLVISAFATNQNKEVALEIVESLPAASPEPENEPAKT